MRKNGIIKQCVICETSFYVPRYKINTAKYCSRNCLNISRIGNPNIGRKKGTKMPKEFCENLSRIFKGRKFTEEHKRKLGNSGRGRFGNKNFNWKNGIKKHGQGYIRIYSHSHPRKDIDGYVFEHRLVVEKHIGRYLLPEEVVHHVNGIVDDNRIENLKLFKNKSEHMKFHQNNPKL